jgi:glutaredoxin-like YruB-family protein
MNSIVIYSTDTCPHCQSAKSYLARKGFDFQEKNVQTDKEARQELIDKGYRGVPVLVIDGTDIVGFDKEKINQLLHL